MEDIEIIDEIKKGRSIQDIKDVYLKKNVPSYNYYIRMDKGVCIRMILDCIEEAGFNLVEQKSDQRAHYPIFTEHMTSWSYENGDFAVCVRLFVPESKRQNTYYHIVFTLPDGSRINTGDPKRSLKEQLNELMELWPSTKVQLEELEYRISKLQRRIDIGESTIDTIIKTILNGRNWTYNVFKKNRDTYLRIRMKYHRCIEIKLLPTMDVTKLVALTSMIETVTNAMDSVGNINLTVKNYGNDINWSKKRTNFRIGI